jgi:hypothetical protein
MDKTGLRGRAAIRAWRGVPAGSALARRGPRAEWMAFFDDPDGHQLAIMPQVQP